MINLSNEEIQKLYKERPRRKEIARGVKHNNRLRFHTETVVDKNSLLSNPYYSEFIAWIASEAPELLPKDKIARFKQLVTVPLPTIELTESITSHLYNVFKGQDAFYRYEFENPELEADWMEYCNHSFWEVHGFEAMISGIDSVWVLDLPKEQSGDKPEPGDRLIDISDVIDISVDADNNCKYVIFSLGDTVYVYDEALIRAFPVVGGDIALLPTFELAHGLGYCPARMFWSDNLMKGNFINKKSPLTNVLGDLDWLLVCHVFKKYMEISNSYPILAAYRSQQNFLGSKQEEERGRTEDEKRPAGADLIGAGSFIEVDPPLAGEHDPMSNPVKFINPDVTTLEFHVKNIIEKRDTIFYSVVGKDSDTTKEAINEKQVMASFESQSAILMRIAGNFKKIEEFADKCKADIRYGVGQLIEVCIDLGTKFFLRTASDLIGEMKEAKDNGSHSSVIGILQDEIIEAKFRNDTAGMTRAQVIQELDPLPDKTLDEAIQILDKGGISKEQFIIKANLLSFVRRFEREQASLVEFGKQIDKSKKIEAILEEFRKYADEIMGDEPAKTDKLPVDKNKPPDMSQVMDMKDDNSNQYKEK